MPKRQNYKQKLNEKLWTVKDGLYYSTEEKLNSWLEASGYSDEELRGRMGRGYSYLADIKNGVGLSLSSAGFVEGCTLPEDKDAKRFTWPPH